MLLNDQKMFHWCLTVTNIFTVHPHLRTPFSNGSSSLLPGPVTVFRRLPSDSSRFHSSAALLQQRANARGDRVTLSLQSGGSPFEANAAWGNRLTATEGNTCDWSVGEGGGNKKWRELVHTCEHQCSIVDTNEEHSFGTSGSSIRYHSNYEKKCSSVSWSLNLLTSHFQLDSLRLHHQRRQSRQPTLANGHVSRYQQHRRMSDISAAGGQLWNAAEFHRLLYGATFCWKWRCMAAYHFSGVENETEACVTCMPTRTRRITLRQHSTPKLWSGNSLYATCCSAVFCIASGEHHFGTSSFIYIVHNCIGYLCYCWRGASSKPRSRIALGNVLWHLW